MTIELSGDHNQSIMRFTGAKPELILQEIEEMLPDIETLGLNKNFRSTATVVACGEETIKYSYQQWGGELDDRFQNAVVPFEDNGEGVPVRYDVYADATEEALGLVDEIISLKEGGEYEYDAHVVLARTRAQLGIVETALVGADIPFLNLTGSSFWNLAHVKTIVQYLRLVCDRGDMGAFKYVQNRASDWMRDRNEMPSSARFFSKDFSSRFESFEDFEYTLYDQEDRYTDDSVDRIKYREMRGSRDFVNAVSAIEAELDQRGPVFAAQWIGEHVVMHHVAMEEGDAGNEDKKREDLKVVYGVIERAGSLDEFFKFVEKALDAQRRVRDGKWDGRVVLSTIHSFKGLQRPVCHVIGLSEGRTINGKTGESEPCGLLPHTYALTTPPSEGCLNFSFQSPLIDERRLFYVAITRAEERLYISTPISYNGIVMGHSRFIEELSEFLNQH